MAAVTTGWRWQELGAEHRRWIVMHAVCVTAGINLVLGGLFAWLSVRTQHGVPLWAVPEMGKSTVITDTVGTFFFLPFMTCLILTTFVWIEVRRGRLPALTTVKVPGRFRGGRARRGALLGTISTAVLSPLAIVALIVFSGDGMTTSAFVLYKAVLSVALGAVVTPLIALWAMADAR